MGYPKYKKILINPDPKKIYIITENIKLYLFNKIIYLNSSSPKIQPNKTIGAPKIHAANVAWIVLT